MADKTIKLTLDVQTKISNLEGEVAKMQKAFQGIKAPENVTKDVVGGFKELEIRLKTVKEYLANNELSLADEKKVRAELTAIEKDFNSLFSKVETNSKKISLANISKEGTVLRRVIEDYNKGIEEGTKKVQAQQREVEKLQQKIAEANLKLQSAQQVRDNAVGVRNDLEASNPQLRQLLERYDTLVDKGRTSNQAMAALKRTKDWDSLSVQGEDAVRVFKEYQQAVKNAEQAEKDFEQQEKKIKKTIEDTNVSLKTAKSTLETLQTELDGVKADKLNDIKKTLTEMVDKKEINLNFDIGNIQSIEELKKHLEDIDEKDMSKVREAIQQYLTAARSGAENTKDFNKSLDRTSESAKQLNSELERIKSRITYFFGLTNAVNLFRRAVRSAFETVKDLDKVMTETAVVTNFSVGDMWKQLPEYTRRANELGVSIHDAYEAATLFYQQGLKTNEVMAVSNETLKMARIAGLDAAEATDRITNALRGFNMAIDEASAKNINDVYSNLAAKTASDVDEISTAMTKVASLAHNANMSFENTAAFLSQIIETTRESAETAGTALKTVIARFSEVKNLYSTGDLLGKDPNGDDIDVNKVSKALRSAGIDLNEYLTGMKGLDDIFMELSAKWDSLDKVQQRYIATMAAGSRQQSRFIALMQDNVRMTELVSEANNSAGASQEQFDKTLESLQSKLARLSNAWKTFLMGLADNGAIKAVIDALSWLITAVNNLTKGLSGLPKSIANIGIAISGFKLGRNVFNKIFQNIGAQLLPGFRKIGEQSSEEVGRGFFGSFKQVFSRFKGGASGRFSTFDIKDLGFKPDKILDFSKLDLTDATIEFKKQIAENLNTSLKDIKVDFAEMGFKDQNAFIEEYMKGSKDAIKAAKELGIQTNITADEAAKAGIKFKGMSDATKNWATACAGAGAILMLLTSLLEKMGFKNKAVLNSIKAMSVALMAMPLIFKTIGAAGVKAGKSIQASFGWISLVIAGLTAIAALIITLVKQNSLAEKIKQAKEAAQAALDSANEAKEAYDNLLSAKSTHDDLITKIEELKEGTVEWKKALFEANQQILEILRTYPELSKYVHRNEKGYLEVEEEGWNYIIDQQKQYSENLAVEAAFKQADVEELEESDKEKIAIQERGRTIETAYDEISAGSTEKSKIRSYERDTLDAVIQYLDREDKKTLEGIKSLDLNSIEDEELRYSVERFKNTLTNNELSEDKIKELLAQIFNAEETAQTEFGILDLPNNSESQVKAAISAMVAPIGEKFKSYQPYENLITDTLSIISEAEIEQQKNDLSNDLDDLKNIYKELNGKEATTDDINELKNSIAQVKAARNKAGLIDQINKQLQGQDERTQKFVSAAISGNFDYFNQSELKDFQGKINEILEETGINSIIKEAEGKGITIDVKTDFDENYSASWTNLEDYFTIRRKEVPKELGDLPKSVVEHLNNQIITTIGKENATDYIKAFLDAADKVPEKNRQQFWNQLSMIKWDDVNQVADAISTMQSLRVDSDLMWNFWNVATEGVKSYVKDEEAALALQTQLNNTLNEGQELQKRLLEGKATEEDRNNLQMQGYDVSQLEWSGEGWKASEEFANQIVEDIRLRNEQLLQAILKKTDEAAQPLVQGYIDYTQQYKIFAEATRLGLDETGIKEYAAELQKLNPLLKNNEILALEVALANIKMNTGLGEIIGSYKDWTALIKDGKIKAETSEDFAVFDKLRKSVEKMLNVSKPLSDAFWDDKANIEALKAAAEGEVEAIEKLQKASASDYLSNLNLEELVLQVDGNKTQTDILSIINDICNIINNQQLPKLEAGVELNRKEYGNFIDDLYSMMVAAGLTEEQINESLGRIGYRVEVVQKEVEYEYITYPTGGATYIDPFTGEGAAPEPIVKKRKYSVPEIHFISTGSGGGGVSQNNITTGKSNKDGGKSSSGSSSKPSYWKNPYDELFNLQEEINETLRDREELERRYQKLLKSETTTIDQIRKSYRDQIAMMQQQIELQRQLAAGRLRQIENLGNQYYTDSEGNRRTYASLGVTQYAHYNAETGDFTIDWDRLEQIANDAGRTAEGEAAEAYINALQELINSYEETRNAIWEIEDAIEDLNNELVESYMSFEDRVMDALVASYEREIESLEKINDAINDATSKVLDGIQKEIDAQRQERENAKTEQEIADKEARLAYLRLDTSGANSLEIMQLEKELEDARENYEDTLIDQALQQMRDDADLAAEQRAEQITLMQAQLDEWIANGELWDDVYELISGAWDENGNLNPNSNLVELLKLTDGTAAMSEVGQLEWWQRYVEDINKFVSGIDGVVAKYWDQLSPWLQAILTELGANPEPVQTPPASGGSNNGGTAPGGNGPGGQQTPPDNQGPPVQTPAQKFAASFDSQYPYGKVSLTYDTLKKGMHNRQVGALTWALAHLGYLVKPGTNVSMTWGYFKDHYDPLQFSKMIEDGVKEFQSRYGLTPDGKIGSASRARFGLLGYKTGGLADFTGPAWLDGTKSHPELVLSARDTENFVALKNILASLMTPDAQTNKTFGDAYFDIDINADISSDYDVDQLADRIKQQIVQDARYRNINMVNFMR